MTIFSTKFESWCKFFSPIKLGSLRKLARSRNAVFNHQTGMWMCMCIYMYIPHISHIVSRRFTILIEWDRTSVCKGTSGCRYQFIVDLTHPPNPWMKCTMKLMIDHHTGNYVLYSFRQVCGFFNVPCWPCNTEDAGDGAYGFYSLSVREDLNV